MAPDSDGRAFGAWAASDWAEEALFAARSNQRGGGWQFAPGHDERDFMARLGAARYRVYAGQLAGDDLEPVELTESPTVIQDPTVAAYGDRRLVAWGERIDNRFVVRAWTGADRRNRGVHAGLAHPTGRGHRHGRAAVGRLAGL